MTARRNHQSYSIPILFLLERWIPCSGQSMLPVSRSCLVCLCTFERFIRYLSHISLIGRVAAINHLISEMLGQRNTWFEVSAVFVYRKHIDNRKVSIFCAKVCLTVLKLHMFGYQASHVCTQLEHVFLSRVRT